MQKKSNTISITKNKAWSLILNAKSLYESSSNTKKTITIKDGTFSLTYSFQKEEIIKNNFRLNEEVQELFNIFLPIILNKKDGPYLIGHLAQSLDGFIATKLGESKYISCKKNIEHIHRIRAIADIILVGKKTITFDDPCLTTRLVKGDNPMRIILDPRNKLKGTEKIFKHRDKNSFRVIGINKRNYDENVFKLPVSNNTFKIKDLISLFKKLKKNIVFIEGGGYTISEFYKGNHLDRLHICLSPTIIGKGKNSFLITGKKSIKDFENHDTRYYMMGKDILCDMNLVTSGRIKYK